MFYPDDNDPYEQHGQESVPYQPYREYTSPTHYAQQQREAFSPPSMYRPPAGSPSSTPARPQQARSTQLRMSKAEALEFVDSCKRWLIAGSIIAFALLSGLVAAHATGVTSSQSTPTSPSPSSGGNYFQQQPGGSNFGSNPFQQPVSGSRVS